MNRSTQHQEAPRPWYREPWPWVLIAIPLLTIVACGITLWLAISRPDYLVVDEAEYQQIKSELRAQETPAGNATSEDPDG